MEPHGLYDAKLRTGDYHPRIAAYYYKQWNGFQMALHAHKPVEIMYVMSGKCKIETDTETLRLKKGDLILLDAEVRHSLEVEESHPCRMLNVEFTFTEQQGAYPTLKELCAGDGALGELLDSGRPYVVLRDSSEAYTVLKSLVLELGEKQEGDEWMTHLLMSQLLVRIARLVKEAKDEERPYDSYIRNCVKFLHQNYDRPIQVKDVAAEVNLHPSYLQRIFKESMDCTVMDYLTGLRIDKAMMLLTHTDLPVHDIPEYIGISTREYFSAVFKKRVGLAPGAYRKSRELFHHPAR
ncbi:hypothetical protein SY83_03390 [Paenibacillus swuensis]|uniref:HTH araC/xylS-type domain-containing protein n=1 Tax=Paenibacillus swuensis TaxID=1178515 RepID=A0A172TNQ8_9BACL|nr:AraC family transcriptional regulator [Paenibacillus swuensis]ANE48695.1 hypothetical protein SY83_03390 [Paenibacillus swuensis]